MRGAILFTMLLAGCNEPLSSTQKDEVGDIAGDVAVDMIDDSSRISDLESRIEELEAKSIYD